MWLLYGHFGWRCVPRKQDRLVERMVVVVGGLLFFLFGGILRLAVRRVFVVWTRWGNSGLRGERFGRGRRGPGAVRRVAGEWAG